VTVTGILKAKDGRHVVGVHIRDDGYGKFVADVLIPRETPTEVFSLPGKRLHGPTFDTVAEEARKWVDEHIPSVYGIEARDLEVRLLKDDEVWER